MAEENVVEPINADELVVNPPPKKQDPQQETVKPAVETVTIGGVAYTVTPEMKASLEAEQRRNQEEMEALRSRQQLPQNPPPEQPKQPEQPAISPFADVGDRLFSEPEKVLEELYKKARDDSLSEAQRMYNAAEAAKLQKEEGDRLLSNFYNDFFSKHKEFAEDRELVELIFEKNFKNWSTSYPQQQEKWKDLLAEASGKTILRHTGKNPSQKQGVVLESGGQPVEGMPPKPSEENVSYSAVEILKQRQAARKQAMSLPKK